MIIAIDGPSGTGKSTTARQVAKRLGFLYIDSGGLYRVYTLAALNHGVTVSDERGMIQLLEQTRVELENSANGSLFFLNGIDVSTEIRGHEVTAYVSAVSQNPLVRERVNRKLRSIASEKSIVVDGRDIGTVVFPDAQLKIYLDASPDERARRRLQELHAQGRELDFSQVKSDLELRDKKDSQRSIAPLAKAIDSITLDTTNMSFDEVVETIVDKAQKIL